MKKTLILLFFLAIFSNVTKAQGSWYTITVRSAVGLSFVMATLEVSGSDSISDVKDKLTYKLSLSRYAIRLIFAGKELEDGRTLNDYNITKDSTIFMIAR